MSKTLHCTFCGNAQTDTDWPKTCPGCKKISYRNPIPVAVAVVPIRGANGTGLLAIRRDIEPQKGELALPGGYVDHAETWQEACVREVREETDIDLDLEGISLFDLLSVKGGPLLIFCLTQPLEESKLPEFKPTNETSERMVIWEAQGMAFPLHTQVVNAYFAKD